MLTHTHTGYTHTCLHRYWVGEEYSKPITFLFAWFSSCAFSLRMHESDRILRISHVSSLVSRHTNSRVYRQRYSAKPKIWLNRSDRHIFCAWVTLPLCNARDACLLYCLYFFLRRRFFSFFIRVNHCASKRHDWPRLLLWMHTGSVVMVSYYLHIPCALCWTKFCYQISSFGIDSVSGFRGLSSATVENVEMCDRAMNETIYISNACCRFSSECNTRFGTFYFCCTRTSPLRAATLQSGACLRFISFCSFAWRPFDFFLLFFNWIATCLQSVGCCGMRSRCRFVVLVHAICGNLYEIIGCDCTVARLLPLRCYAADAIAKTTNQICFANEKENENDFGSRFALIQ